MTPPITEALLLAAVRRVLPDVEGWQLDVREYPSGQPPTVRVYGDVSWLDWMPPAPAGHEHRGELVALYHLGVAVLAVHIDTRARGTA